MVTYVTKPIYLPCGNKAVFDYESGIGHRCMHCTAIVGSMGQPRSCAEEIEKYEVAKKLGMPGWNYSTGTVMEKM